MNKAIKIISTIMIVMAVVLTMSTYALAGSINYTNPNSVGTEAYEDDNMLQWGTSIVNLVATIGVFASVITLIVLGIKYMLGSVEEKSEYKKTLMPYFIGAVLVFGACAIADVIANMASNIS